MSEEKKDPKVEAKPTDDSASEKPSAEKTAKAEAAKAVKEAKVSVDAADEAEAAANKKTLDDLMSQIKS